MSFKKKKSLAPGINTVVIGNAHHQGARENQQDSFAISDISNLDLCRRHGVFCVLADGMGGMYAGGAVSNLVTQSMLRQFSDDDSPASSDVLLLRMVEDANRLLTQQMDGMEKGGSTVVAVIIQDGCISWATVGDSRLCLVRGGAMIQINREHSYGIELDERAAKNEISWEEAKMDPQRPSLTSYLGMDRIKLVDRNIRPVRLLPGDRVLLMSDGVFNTLSDDEILATITDDPHESAVLLEQSVIGKALPYQDNFTAIILKMM